MYPPKFKRGDVLTVQFPEKGWGKRAATLNGQQVVVRFGEYTAKGYTYRCDLCKQPTDKEWTFMGKTPPGPEGAYIQIRESHLRVCRQHPMKTRKQTERDSKQT